MKHLIIIGARGFGREVYHSAIESKGYGLEFDIKGYLDDKVDALTEYNGYPPIIGTVESYQMQEDDVFICALGDVKWKKHYAQIILDKGGKFISLIHERAEISKNVLIGDGCIICPQSRISCDVSLGDFVTIQPYVFVGHDAKINDWCHVNTNVSISGFVTLSEGVTIHTSAVLVPKILIGENSIVGAGSVALNDVPANATVFGNPARAIFHRE